MRWTPGGMSGDIEDRRSEGSGGFRGSHIGVGGLLLLLLLSLIFKRDFVSSFLGPSGVGQAVNQPAPNQSAPALVQAPGEESLVQFVSFVLDDTQKTWERLL